jgi:hypothetical protein
MKNDFMEVVGYLYLGVVVGLFIVPVILYSALASPVVEIEEIPEPVMSCSSTLFEQPQFFEWKCEGKICSNGITSCERAAP